MRCTKHNVETAVTCGRCETPVCPKCMVHTDVGVRCRDCAPSRPRVGVSRGTTVFALGVAVVAGIVALGAIGGGYSGGGSDDPYDYLGDLPEFEALDITAEQVVDPWTAEAADLKPSPGHRFVAIEVLVEDTGHEDAAYGYTDPYYFKLTDSEGFAYPAFYQGATPLLSGVDLDEGEKTRGWLTFEVTTGNELASLTYVGEDVPLP